VEVTLDNRVESDRVIDLLSGETFKVVRSALGLARQPDPYVILQKVTSDSAVYEIRFYFWPDQINPSRAQSSVLIPAIEILQKNEIPMSVTQIELTQKPDLAFILGEEEKQGALSRAPLFAHALDSEQLEQLSRSCALAEFPRRAVLMRQGDPATCMYIIMEGAVSISIAGGDGGTPHEVAVSASGDVLGEMAFMTGGNRTATATALARVRALEIGKADIESLLRANPGLAQRFAQTLARRQQELDEAAHHAARKESQATDILARMMSFFSRAFA
jgi:CRP-like cAMP-binding protein